MAVLIKPNGFTAAAAPTILTEDFATTSGVVWVDSATGSDSNTGLREELPKATVFGASGALASASIVTATSGMVICKKSHREAIGASYTFAKAGVTVISLGSGTDVAAFTANFAGVNIDVTGLGIRFENLYFPASTALSTARIRFSAAGGEIRSCIFDVGASDVSDTVLVNAVGHCSVIASYFVVVATAASGTAQVGVRSSGAAVNFLLEDCTFDGGGYGWTDSPYKSDNIGVDYFRVRGLTLRNFSKVRQTATGATGYISALVADPSSGWDWLE